MPDWKYIWLTITHFELPNTVAFWLESCSISTVGCRNNQTGPLLNLVGSGEKETLVPGPLAELLGLWLVAHATRAFSEGRVVGFCPNDCYLSLAKGRHK